MNAPQPNFYDPQNASRLCQASAESYSSHSSHQSHEIDRLSTDTHATLWQDEANIMVAFRGTADLRNWLTDLDCKRAPLHWCRGKVHVGFAAALESIAEPLDEALDPGDPRRLWITGHSLGGALAMLCALRLKLRRGMNVAGVYTFGQPRVGNIPFSLAYDESLKARTWRVVQAEDIVPRLPWQLGAYRHAGHEIYYGGDGRALLLQCPNLGGDAAPPYRVDRPFWTRLAEDLALACILPEDPLAPLVGHHVSRYQELFASEFPIPLS